MDDRLGFCAGRSDGIVGWVVEGAAEFDMTLLFCGDFSRARDGSRSRRNRVVGRADSGSSTLVGGGATLGARGATLLAGGRLR